MISRETCLAILNAIDHAIVFVDNEHIIRHLNKAAEKRYYEGRGYHDLIGKSLLDYHNSASRTQIGEVYQRLKDGEDQVDLGVNKYNERTTVVAIRDGNRNLLGYFEWFEPVGDAGVGDLNKDATERAHPGA